MTDSATSPGGDGRNAHLRSETPNHIEIHRVTDFVYGHVGRVSYQPSDEEDTDIGNLNLNRITEQAPFFQEVLPFKEWIPAMRTNLPTPSLKTSQVMRSQRNWLLKAHPEAFLGNQDLQHLLSEQAQASHRHDAGEDSQLVSLLSVGEITDLTGSWRGGASPAVAMAAGEAGHILRLSSIHVEKWGWETRNASLPLGTSKSSFQGFWSSDGVPISQIRFATKRKKHDHTRWLIVQRSTSTTIFAPQLRKTPLRDAASNCYLDLGKPNHIAANPIVTLTTDSTGGDSQCDFSFDPGFDDGEPQLAIIGRSGNWSVWYIARERFSTTGAVRAVLRCKGAVAGMPSLMTPSPITPRDGRFQSVWVGNAKSIEDWEASGSPSKNSRSAASIHRHAFLDDVDSSDARYDKLLVSDGTNLQLLDVAGSSSFSSLSFFKCGSVDLLLDAQRFHGSPSHVFVLTTKKLFLLDTATSWDQVASSPTIVLSCPHLRCHDQGDLKMTVAKLASKQGEQSSLVLLFSSRNLRVNLFCFTVSDNDGNVRFHQQTVHLSGSAHVGSSDLRGLQSLTAIPLQLLHKASRGEDVMSEGSQESQPQYYQLVGLGIGLSLITWLVAIADRRMQALMPPHRSITTRWHEARQKRFLRKKFLRQTETSFISTDELDHEAVALRQARVARDIAHSTPIVQLRYYLLRVFQEIKSSLSWGEAALAESANSHIEPFVPIREAIETQEEGGYIALTPLLAFSTHLQLFSPAEVESDWHDYLRQLRKTKQVQILEHGTYSRKLNVADLFEKLSVNWSAKLPAELLNGAQRECMRMALEKMAIEVYLSEQGLKLVPQSILNLESRTTPLKMGSQVEAGIDEDEFAFSQRKSETALLTPSATPSSSRAASETTELGKDEVQDREQEQEDPAVSRLRMYMRSIKFVPPSKHGPSRVLSLWPEQRGSDPEAYKFSLRSKGSNIDSGMEEAKKRRQKEEERRKKRAERKALLGMDRGTRESTSQPMPTVIRSSPPPQTFSQGQSQSQSQSQGFSFQTMSQPVAGEFGARLRTKKKAKPIKKRTGGFC